jgi:hypothetical protein
VTIIAVTMSIAADGTADCSAGDAANRGAGYRTGAVIAVPAVIALIMTVAVARIAVSIGRVAITVAGAIVAVAIAIVGAIAGIAVTITTIPVAWVIAAGIAVAAVKRPCASEAAGTATIAAAESASAIFFNITILRSQLGRGGNSRPCGLCVALCNLSEH